MGSNGMLPWILRELADTKLLSNSLLSLRNGGQEVCDDWRKASVPSIFQKGSKEELGNYWPVSLTIIPRKVVEQITLKIITMHVEEM